MSDRKWLNLVIFLISAMIILFLILQKGINNNTSRAPLVENILGPDFNPTRLQINNRWIPIEQIRTEIGQANWLAFNNDWENHQPMAILTKLGEQLQHAEKISLVWVGERNRKSFILIPSKTGLVIQTVGQNSTIYSYDANWGKRLLPQWLIDKIASQ